VPTEAPPTAREAPPPTGPSEGPADDIRRARPYLLRPAPWAALLRRSASIAALALMDVAGLALGIYLALVLRSLVSALGHGAPRVAAGPRSHHRARVPPGGPLRAA
jgi:hypothetical protein